MKLGLQYSYLKKNIEIILLEINQNIKEKETPATIFQLEESARKLNNADMKYIEKLQKAIDSVLLSDEQKIKLLYELEIPKEEKK
jgi:hypothetical protein